ncbi:MAG: AbrB/MazE/SpoVT family DNA-binding domain-containing protein [archaeon]
MIQKKGTTPEGVEYNYYQCKECGEEIVDMKQLHSVADKYRKMKKYTARLSKWGESMGLRIPKELTKKYNLKVNEDVSLLPEKEGIKIIAK